MHLRNVATVKDHNHQMVSTAMSHEAQPGRHGLVQSVKNNLQGQIENTTH